MISATTTTTTTSTTSISSNGNLSGITFHLLNVPTKLSNVDSLTRASHKQNKEEIMSDCYIPSDSDICCGRGKQNWNMTGNLHFRKLIRASVARYTAAPSKKEKSAVILSVVDEIRGQGGHFLKQRQHQQNGSSKCCWYDIGDAAARDKVSHSLRDQAGSSASSAAESPLQLSKKEHARRTADAADDCDSDDSGAAAVARLEETSSLSALSCTEEAIVDSVDSDAPKASVTKSPLRQAKEQRIIDFCSLRCYYHETTQTRTRLEQYY
jgi:hypothetical protein